MYEIKYINPKTPRTAPLQSCLGVNAQYRSTPESSISRDQPPDRNGSERTALQLRLKASETPQIHHLRPPSSAADPGVSTVPKWAREGNCEADFRGHRDRAIVGSCRLQLRGVPPDLQPSNASNRRPCPSCVFMI